MASKNVLVGQGLEELAELMAEFGEPSYRAKQLVEWVYRPVAAIEQMSSLPLRLRDRLMRETIYHPCSTVTVRRSQDGTRKYLLALQDGEHIESVYIPENDRSTVCISSQVGCQMGCTFCATGGMGFVRNLTAGEIVDQVLQVILDVGRRPSNVVFMGMGEPLANYSAVLRSIKVLNAPWGLNIGIRQLTVSTCGLVPGIRKLAQEGLGLTLAVSLHSADDEKRSRIMPIARIYNLEELLDALHEYAARTGRRITIEYALMDGFNDSPEDAHRLTEILRGLLCHVNLIPVNPIPGGFQKKPRDSQVARFESWLRRGGLVVSIRKERGADIEAACGQLRGRWEGV
ncbi:MAG TPA: 23S rRNA (adenine(2503)-C(2))-methyltransferase RlmN [Firmicutes bacterium]|nr:23S rRNA (adenine(2503)-C(2))-methyltransferase RlmN [Bacillota bacterium]